MGDYTAFTKKQADYIKASLGSWLNVAEGGKRAGKNVINTIAFGICVDEHEDRFHLAAGVTAAAARMNIIDSNGFGLLNFFKGRCRETKFDGKQALLVDTKNGQKVIIIEGGGKANDPARIKGNSFGSVYISEANEVHRDFFFETLDRTLASTRRRLFFDLNAKPAGHWFYREFLDRQDDLKRAGENKGYNYGHFTIFDNLSISNEKLAKVLKSYNKKSSWYKSDILGDRVSGQARIYTEFDESLVLSQKEISKMEFAKFAIGIDVGGTDATVATLVGIKKGGGVCLIDGYYHKQGSSTGYTHEKYAEKITEKIKVWGEKFPGLFFSGAVFCESADKLFRQALSDKIRAEGLRITVYPSYKKDGILDRIRFSCILMARKKFWVYGGLSEWLEALNNAEWDERALSSGEWVRKDDGSYPVDCLDSMEYGIVPFKKELI